MPQVCYDSYFLSSESSGLAPDSKDPVFILLLLCDGLATRGHGPGHFLGWVTRNNLRSDWRTAQLGKSLEVSRSCGGGGQVWRCTKLSELQSKGKEKPRLRLLAVPPAGAELEPIRFGQSSNGSRKSTDTVGDSVQTELDRELEGAGWETSVKREGETDF